MIIKNGIDKAIKKSDTRFFTPGHKGKGGGVLHYDITEIDGTDNLTCPQGILMEAQNEAAAAFGAEHTFFLVNGSTIGLHTLIMSVCQRGDYVCVDRNCHVAVINGLILRGVTPVFVYPQYNALYNIYGGISSVDVENVLRHNPKIKAVIVTSPTYYGICSNIWEIAQTTHNKGIPLIVDEAHGAHFCFSDTLPLSALQAGADACVQSTHKTLNCLTQGSMLHIKSKLIDPALVKDNLNLLQTTSPSYLLMASLDNARHFMQKNGERLLEKTIRECAALRAKLNDTGVMRCLDAGIVGSNNIHAVDETRLCINFPQNAELVRLRLQEKYGIYAEFTDCNNIVCIATVANTATDFLNLCVALQETTSAFPPIYTESEERVISDNYIPRTALVMPPAECYDAEAERIAAANAIDRIAARTICRYPPGIPIIVPGERITSDIAEYVGEAEITVVRI